MFSRFIHVVACVRIFCSFLWLNNVPLYGYTTVHLPLHPRGFSQGADGRESVCNRGDPGSILGTLDKEMAIHSSILASRMPWTEELSELQSRGWQRVKRYWVIHTLTLSLSSSIGRHLGGFYLSTLLTKAAVGVQESTWVSAFSSFGCMYLEVELVDHMAILCLTFWRIAKLFSMMAVTFYIPISNAPEFQCLHLLTNTCY